MSDIFALRSDFLTCMLTSLVQLFQDQDKPHTHPQAVEDATDNQISEHQFPQP